MANELLTTVRDGIGTITFNRPDVMNAVAPPQLEEFIAAMQKLEADDAVRVIVITGAGKAFCAGGDMGFLQALTKMSPDEIKRTVYRAFLGATRTVKLCPKPTIAAVNGAAVGAGCEIAVACDFRLMSTKGFFWENWIDIGVIPPLGGMFLLPRLIGLERASNMVMRSTRVYGEEAKAIGLATEVCEPEALMERAMSFAGELARRSRQALAIAKQGLRRGLESSLSSEWEFNLQAQAMLISGPDFAEAVAAIEAKRPPVFK
jgi:enoyl-CoA hydratase/carnithine racemase